MRTFGSDPELMIIKYGEIFSAIGILKGNLKSKISQNGYEFYCDNVLAECAIKPSKSKKETIDHFRECFQIFAKLVHPYKLAIKASHTFTNKQLSHPDAREAGCAPDMCAYKMKRKLAPKRLIEKENLRSGGGHIHLGSPTLLTDGPEPILTVYMMDLLLGVTSVWLDRDPTSANRRKLYGQAGRYRRKSDYGLEYRSLGNFWLVSPKMVGLIYDLTMHSLDLVENRNGWEMWEFDFNKFFDRGELSDTWTCNAYDPKKLCKGINAGNKEILSPFFDRAKSLMTVGLRRDLEKMLATEVPDFYASWGLT